MMHQRAGFSIIEMMISMLISAMLMTACLTIYNQISKGALRVQRITSLDTQIMILRDRLTTDLQGLSPLWFTPEHYEKLADLKKKENSTSQSDTNKNVNSSKNNKRNNFLYAQSNNDQFDILTFISTNALQVYGDKTSRVIRVVYVLQKDDQFPNSFKLMRKQEDTISADFDLEKLKSGTLCEIAHRIVHCKIEYGFIDQSPEQRAKGSDKPASFKFVTTWGTTHETKQKDEYIPALPDLIKLTIKMQYGPDQAIQTYELFCPIPASQTSAIKSFAEKKYYAERNAKNQNTAPKGATPPGAVPIQALNNQSKTAITTVSQLGGKTPNGASPNGASPHGAPTGNLGPISSAQHGLHANPIAKQEPA